MKRIASIILNVFYAALLIILLFPILSEVLFLITPSQPACLISQYFRNDADMMIPAYLIIIYIIAALLLRKFRWLKIAILITVFAINIGTNKVINTIACDPCEKAANAHAGCLK